MKYEVALFQAKQFCKERREDVRIAIANKNGHCELLFKDQEPSKNHKVIEIIRYEN